MNRQKKLEVAENYVLYYGSRLEKEIGNFDIAVLEPAGQTPDSLHEIKKNGTLVLAYLSVMEIAAWEPELRMLKQGDFLQSHGRSYINPAYGNYWMDLRSNDWRDLLGHRANRLLNGAQYDGLYLDTIGYVEAPFLYPDLRAELLRAAADWVQRLRSSFPEHLIIQNGGLVELCHYTANFVNGFSWENPPLQNVLDTAWVQGIIAKLAYFRNMGHKIFLLWENPDESSAEAQQLVAKNGFLAYWAPGSYAAGIKAED